EVVPVSLDRRAGVAVDRQDDVATVDDGVGVGRGERFRRGHRSSPCGSPEEPLVYLIHIQPQPTAKRLQAIREDHMARFNHLELTVPKGTLDDEGKKKIVGFYHELFGWSEATIASSSKNTELSPEQRRMLEWLQQPGYLVLRCSPQMPDQSLILSEAD